ncbi:proline--tRNA ligase [Candidatus Woesearchaeota archaeon]|nr:proline--tRNA ligase [Candidatus Woesearchaeota archaeon]
MPKQEKNEMGITVKKSDDVSEWYTQVIQKAELAEYTGVSGCMIFRPRAYAIWEKLQQFFNEEIKKLGVQNAYFPLFIPEALLKRESEHVQGFAPEVAWVTQGGDSKLNERLAVRPTSETVMYDAYAKWIRSYRDLPLKINQWVNVIRWEFKHPVPFLRSREFLWQEGHTVHAKKEDAEKEVLDILELYHRLFEEMLAIPVIKGKKSENEKFAGADYSTSVETIVPSGKAVQAATSHHLGQRFAKSFNISFLNEKGEKQLPFQNSWGFSTRSIGAMILFHSDDKGLVIPPMVAPTQAVIVPILFDDTKEKVLKASNKVKELLKEFSVMLDDRDSYTPGWKFNEWELKGVPLRIEIGPKDVTNDSVVIVRRDTGEKTVARTKEVNNVVKELLDTIQKNLFEKAKKWLKDNTADVKNWDEFVKAVEQKKMIPIAWCEKTECAEQIKEKTEGVKVLNIPFDQPKKFSGECAHCKSPAKIVALFAKSY